jgi:7,8-dihydropterin-6-yl-methyl-4-(beta-D-ribofuranosyl)aminobenzene 5'-phosphate synthase
VRLLSVVDNVAGTAFDQSKLVRRHDSPERHFLAEHGFSVLVESDSGKRVLLDAGASRIVFDHNLALFGISPGDIDAAVISHGHYDHVGGLPSLIQAGVPIYTHPLTFSAKRYVNVRGQERRLISPSAEIMSMLPKAKLRYSSAPVEVVQGVRTSGEVQRNSAFENVSSFQREVDGALLPDDLMDEQALYISTKRGIMVVTGCGHPGIVNIVQQAKRQLDRKVFMVVGGLHMSMAPPDRILRTMEALKNLGVEHVAPMHCSGFTAMKSLSDRFVGFDLMVSGSQLEI